ncbi:uncharacterized protein LOC118515176 isoform X1 [Anopheles stephensi]|uniref:uncharacterized protein LOC118515176 isoform X1 n=1 Tax=Anopheles stephensi TaxID=30069 RepID=UPI0016589EAB|nr:uncharacterized protein LOC118515176 isoform X1 [Anopheles stephensi]
MATDDDVRLILIRSDELMMEQPAVSETIDGGTYAKHKNPERMLQSVERLTQELVSQLEERHVRTNPEECSSIVTGIQFKIGEKVTTGPGGTVALALNDRLHGDPRVGLIVDDEGNRESEEPPSILYQMSMPFVQHIPVVLNSIDCISLAPLEDRTTPVVTTTRTTTMTTVVTATATATTTTTVATSRVIKPVRVVSNPGSPRTRKLQRESSINKEADESKVKPIKIQDVKSVKKEQQTKIAKPVVETVTKVSRVRQPVLPKGGAIITGRTPAKPSIGSPIHRPVAKPLATKPYAQRSATKKLQRDATRQQAEAQTTSGASGSRRMVNRCRKSHYRRVRKLTHHRVVFHR